MKLRNYEEIYKRMDELGIFEIPEHGQKRTAGYMPLSVDRLICQTEGREKFALAHNYEQNGDLMADPDMEVWVNHRTGIAEALTYQQDNEGVFQTVYEQVGSKTYVNKQAKEELNAFLLRWLRNLKKQGFEEVKFSN